MAQVQKVSWRTVGYAALGTAAVIAGTVGIVNSDGVRPTSLKSNSATRWLVDQPNHLLVLADGLTGRVLARIDAASGSANEVAYQGAGGAYLVAPDQGSVRTISTAKLQLGTPQKVSALSQAGTEAKLGVGANGLTVVNAQTDEASIVAVDDVARPITVPPADQAMVARDGSIWLFTSTKATHVSVDETSRSFDLNSAPDPKLTVTVGGHAVYLDRSRGVVRWVDGQEVPVDSIANIADAVMQQSKGDEAPCVWLAAHDTLACVGKTGIDRTVKIDGLNVGPSDNLAVAGSFAVVVHQGTSEVQRIDLDARKLITTGNPDTTPGVSLSIAATNGMIWIDEDAGDRAWVIHRFGVNSIQKNDESVPVLDAQGQVKDQGVGDGPSSPGVGNPGGNEEQTDHLDKNGHDDPPTAVDDSVTARAGNTITVPVLANDFDPDGDAIAVLRVGDLQPAGHGSTDVLDGGTVSYVPEVGFSGTDSFSYTIVDENGGTATATVSVELFPSDSPNRPPIAQADHVKTRLGRPVIIDVLANDIDPERDTLSIQTFGQASTGTITETKGPTQLPALKYVPPVDEPGVYTFTYQAADPLGGTSTDTEVTVDVLGPDADNTPPVANPDAIRLPVGVVGTLDVKANDVDDDGDDLTIGYLSSDPAVDVQVRGQRLVIRLEPGAPERSVIRYSLTDTNDHQAIGHVLVLKIGDTAENRPPVTTADTDRVVIGNSVKVAVTANDVDPDHDNLTLVSVEQPKDNVGTAVVEGNSVRFTPSLTSVEEPTPVSFTYRIGDGHDHFATGNVTITILAEPLPRAPDAQDDFADTVVGKPVNIDVLANDSDPSGGRPSLVGDPSCPNGGTATVTDDQRVTFVPPDQPGTYRCKYQVGNTTAQASANIIVTVSPAPEGNHVPEMVAGETFKSVSVGSSITLNAGVVARDDDAGDSLMFSSVSKPSIGSTNFSDKSQTFVYTAPLPGSSDAVPTVISLDITISDGHDGNVRGSISIKINPSTPPAQLPTPTTLDIPLVTTVGNPVRVDVPATLREANNGTLVSLVSASLDSGQAAVNVDGGAVEITPSAAGTVVVTYTVQNSDQVRASGKIRVTVNEEPPANPAPVAVDDVLEIASGGSNSVNLLANDAGIDDPGDVASATLLNRPPTSFGTVSLDNGILTLVATPGAAGSATIDYIVGDGSGQSDQGSVELTILPCSESPPVAQSAALFTPYVTPIFIDLTPYAVGSIVPGSITGAGLTGPTGTYTPPEGMNGSELITFTVENGCHQTANGVVTIDVNRPPAAHSIDRNLSQGDTLTLLATDIASDDEALNISALQGQPAWVALVAGADGSKISATPPAETLSGTYSFVATVQDPGGLSATATINLVIKNLPPTALPDAYSTTEPVISFDPTQNDFDAEPGPLFVQTISVDPDSSAVIQAITGNVIVVSVPHGISHLTYTIRDSGGLTSSSTITITSNRAPSAPNVAASTDHQPSVSVTVTPADPDGDPVTVDCTLPAVPTGLTLTVFNDPDPAPPIQLPLRFGWPSGTAGNVTIPCFVTDSYGARGDFTVTLTIS